MIRPLFIFCGFFVSVAFASSVFAQDKANCTVRALHGLQTPGGVDKQIVSLKRQLSKPPFSAFKSIKQLSSKKLSVTQGALQKTTLPNGKVLQLSFKEKLLLKQKLRLRMKLKIVKPGTKKFIAGTLFTIADGGTLLVAGTKYQNGTLIVGVTCKAQ